MGPPARIPAWAPWTRRRAQGTAPPRLGLTLLALVQQMVGEGATNGVWTECKTYQERETHPARGTRAQWDEPATVPHLPRDWLGGVGRGKRRGVDRLCRERGAGFGESEVSKRRVDTHWRPSRR